LITLSAGPFSSDRPFFDAGKLLSQDCLSLRGCVLDLPTAVAGAIEWRPEYDSVAVYAIHDGRREVSGGCRGGAGLAFDEPLTMPPHRKAMISASVSGRRCCQSECASLKWPHLWA
jgi:hypothetical protein